MQEVPILVLEDEPDMAREIAAQLTSLGYLARIAATGANQERRRQYRARSALPARGDADQARTRPCGRFRPGVARRGGRRSRRPGPSARHCHRPSSNRRDRIRAAAQRFYARGLGPGLRQRVRTLRTFGRSQTSRVHAGRTGAASGPRRFRPGRAIANLVDNAIKFTPEGGAVAIVARTIEDRPAVRVTDNGRGIPAGRTKPYF